MSFRDSLMYRKRFVVAAEVLCLYWYSIAIPWGLICLLSTFFICKGAILSISDNFIDCFWSLNSSFTLILGSAKSDRYPQHLLGVCSDMSCWSAWHENYRSRSRVGIDIINTPISSMNKNEMVFLEVRFA